MSNHSKHVRGVSRAKKAAALSGGALVAASPFVTAGSAGAASQTFVVTSLTDDGTGYTLREAIADANLTTDADTITFQGGLTGTITLTGQLEVLESVTIQGPGATSVTVDADGNGMAFYVYHDGGSNIDVTISGLTITGGTSTGITNWGEDLTLDGVVLTGNSTGGNGGGLYSTDDSSDGGVPTLTILNSTISDNTAGSLGGGVYAGDRSDGLFITDSVISGNTATQGGGVYVPDLNDVADQVDVRILRTTFSDNEATNTHGGGIRFGDPDGQVEIIDSTFSGNTAARDGGGIYLYDTDNDGTLTISGTTVTGNTAGAEGGGIYLYSPDNETVISNSTITGNTSVRTGGGINIRHATYGVVIEHSTITGNTSSTDGGGLFVYYDADLVTVDHTILSGNAATIGHDDAGREDGEFSGSWSIVGDWAGSSTNIIVSTDPMLGALADNGGETKTMLPQAGSPAIDAGNPAFTGDPTTDQRGVARVANGRIDIGAVEVQPATLPPTGGSNGLMAAMGAALLGLGGALHLGSKRRRPTA